MEIQLKIIGNTPSMNVINTYTPDMSYGDETHHTLGRNEGYNKTNPQKIM